MVEIEWAALHTLVGKTLVSVTVLDEDGECLSNPIGGEIVQFETDAGELYRLYHNWDCSRVVVEDVLGHLSDLVGSPLHIARQDSNVPTEPKILEGDWDNSSFTWTFYNFATAKGHVTIRWYGCSNGYYSESVEFGRVVSGVVIPSDC